MRSPPPKYQLTKLLTWKPKGAHQAKCIYTWDMREATKTYARSPVHSLCALCPSPPKDQLTKTANLDTQRGKSSQKHPGDMRDAIKTYAGRTVHNLCNFCFSPRSPGYCNLQAKISTSVPANLPSAVNYSRKSIFWCAASRQVL